MQYYTGIVMISDEFGKIGSKGELYLPKKLRNLLGLEPNSRIRYFVSPKGYLMIEKVISIEELLKSPSLAKVTVEEIEKISVTMQKKGENNSD